MPDWTFDDKASKVAVETTAKGLNALFVALGIDLPTTGTVLASRTIIVSLLVGTIVTVVASLIPARQCQRCRRPPHR